MKSVMEHQFSQAPRIDIPRSSFNRTSGRKGTYDADILYPVFIDEVLPGDSFNLKATYFGRLNTPLWPFLDNLYLDTQWFYCPSRIVWNNFEKMLGAQEDPDDTIDYTVPKIDTDTAFDPTTSDMYDHMGLPNHSATVDLTEINALPFRCYNAIWAAWYRDQNLQDSPSLNKADTGDTIGSYFLRKRGKRHDYFTSSLPWPQKGDSVAIPLGLTAPVTTQVADAITGTQQALSLKFAGGGADVTTDRTLGTKAAGAMGPDASSKTFTGGSVYPSNLVADLTGATGATINDWRVAFQTQRLLERDARSGTRMVETVKAHFGVTIPDYRPNRPEFLAQSSKAINITPVANSTAVGTQGELAAFGTVSGQASFNKSFVEHGYIIGLASIRADITYSQGIERMWLRDTRYDFFYPVLAHLGEQVVENIEIYQQNTSADHDVFGYQERYAEYRYKPSHLVGLMRPNATGTLAAWNLSEEFTSLPTLGDTFIQSNANQGIDRGVAIPAEPHMLIDWHFDLRCARPMPLYGVPGNLDHF